ncbi:hypothetical protein [Nonomuraea gerenzanensis]|uniref:Pycsar effector protein domain-containing protein n=1 Tax=Nonomuraea gerenzanensis TaxID=93944 RepID=A0A1M4EM95_9ACTN|nr:hypothetical protein [Nonomuraea gerenzanensis]UBU11483.1 hypothetical protein LCN96_45395 [Nonomuraea gerenzanensis]SBO99969.1 hypothetical protein BN4615_P9485 [Nonomuraea gerenzanensis]
MTAQPSRAWPAGTARRILDEVRGEAIRADTKASVLLGMGAVAVSATLVGFYGDVLAQDSAQGLVAALERSARAELETLAGQLFAMSRLVRRKYLLIQIGAWLLAGAAAAWLLSPFLA